MEGTLQKNYIKNCIRSYYKGRMLMPFLYIVLALVLCIFLPIVSMLFPKNYDDRTDLNELFVSRNVYGNFSLHDLYFTGYTKENFDNIIGYYYYTMMDSECVTVLLAPEFCRQGIPEIAEVTIRARLMKDSYATTLMLDQLAGDLNWTKDGIRETVSNYTISQCDATDSATRFLIVAFTATFLYAAISLLALIVFTLFPRFSPPVLFLMGYGNPAEILRQAEEELSETELSFGDNDMFITKHYFIETSDSGVAIVPIDRIVWVYKYSTLHKILWHHFKISYTLHIVCEKKKQLPCPKNFKSDLDKIMSILNTSNPNILVGFSEENRLKVEQIFGDYIPWQRIWALLNKKV